MVQVTKAQIGNQDFDLVSELSERVSVASWEPGSSSEDGDEEMAEEAGSRGAEEADQEYTIYEQLPVRRPQPAPAPALAWVSRPGSLATHEGKILTLQCTVAGDTPVGNYRNEIRFNFFTFHPFNFFIHQMWRGLRNLSQSSLVPSTGYIAKKIPTF